MFQHLPDHFLYQRP